MSAIDSLIGPPPAHRRAAASGVRTLLVGGDVVVRLREDPTRAEVAIYSILAPVCVPALQRARIAGAYRHTAHPEARWRIRLDAPGERLLLAQIWPQAALDSTLFGRQLAEQAHRHRRWSRHCSAQAPEAHVPFVWGLRA